MSKSFASSSTLRLAAQCFASSSSSSSSSSSCIASSSSRPFSTTPAPQKPSSQRRFTALRAKREASRPKVLERNGPDYVLGTIRVLPDERGRLPNNPVVKDPWAGCRLARTIVHPKDVWNTPAPNYEAGERPVRLISGLSERDQEIVFGAVPMISTQLAVDPHMPEDRREERVREEVKQQSKQTEMLMRIMDLRNADRATINAYNRQRIIEEFGGNDKGTDCGSSFVQAALLTLRIRNMNEHVMSSKKDVDSRLSMRKAIFARAKHLRYIRKKWPLRYDQLLVDIGVDPSTVEGELKTML